MRPQRPNPYTLPVNQTVWRYPIALTFFLIPAIFAYEGFAQHRLPGFFFFIPFGLMFLFGVFGTLSNTANRLMAGYSHVQIVKDFFFCRMHPSVSGAFWGGLMGLGCLAYVGYLFYGRG